MKRYMLLRENEEFGSYSLDELRLVNLDPTDLIWVEGESEKWQHPVEIEELKGLVLLPQIKDTIPLIKKKKSYSLFSILTSPVAAIITGLFVSTFIIEKAAEGFQHQYGTYRIMAATPVQSIERPSQDIHHALVVESSPKEEHNNKAFKKIKHRQLVKMVSLKSNDYKVSVLGGIENLRLTVNNSCVLPLDEVEIKIQYFDTEGKTVKTEFFNVNNVAANGTKSLFIPKTSGAVKVKYKITNVKSKLFGKLYEV